jgi:hypothetical protein
MDGWRASQQPQTSICRGRLGGETQTTRERHGDCRYLMAAMRITDRQMHLSGTIRKVLAEAGSRESGIGGREAEAEGSGFGAQEEQHNSNPPARDCSHIEAVAGNGHAAPEAVVDASGCHDDACDELESRRREFLAALQDDAATVHSPFTDGNGMLIDEPSEAEEVNFLPLAAGAESQSSATAVSSRPLSRKERRARQRLLERKLRKAK